MASHDAKLRHSILRSFRSSNDVHLLFGGRARSGKLPIAKAIVCTNNRGSSFGEGFCRLYCSWLAP